MSRESIRRRPLSYSSRDTLMTHTHTHTHTHTDLLSCVASSPTHLSSLQGSIKLVRYYWRFSTAWYGTVRLSSGRFAFPQQFSTAIDPFTVYVTGKFEVRSAHVGVRTFIPSHCVNQRISRQDKT